MRGQISLEVLIISGFAALLFIPILVDVSLDLSSAQYSLAISQLDVSAEKLASATDSVGYSGVGSKIVVAIKVPSGVTEVRTTKNEIVLRWGEDDKKTDIVKNTHHQLEILSTAIVLRGPATYRFLISSQTNDEGRPIVVLEIV
ncbi:MAG: hypothetical protein QXW70_01475 [Candidatus Anstonellales archaeon]